MKVETKNGERRLTLEKAPIERAAFIVQACAEDAALRDELETLLAAHEHPEGFLDSAPPFLANEDGAAPRPVPGAPFRTLRDRRPSW